jgi:hypothetical protein
MMTQIKIGLAFLLGGIYASCIWIALFYFRQENLWVLIAAMSALSILTILALASILTFFIKNWGRR